MNGNFEDFKADTIKRYERKIRIHIPAVVALSLLNLVVIAIFWVGIQNDDWFTVLMNGICFFVNIRTLTMMQSNIKLFRQLVKDLKEHK